MSRSRARNSRGKINRPRWQAGRNRGRLWWAGLAAVAVALVAGIIWLRISAPGGTSAEVQGQEVKPFELPNVVTGETWSLGNYLGKKEIVIVSYMGFFCVGCDELLAELQPRQAEFKDRDAELVVLGSLPESMDFARRKATSKGLTYPLLHDAGTKITKQLGLWSDHMQMPWMGYLIIDKTGRVTASDLQLSEAKGAAPQNVNEILHALDKTLASAR